MPTFRDLEGDTWQLVITVGHLDALNGLGLDLSKALTSKEGFADLFGLEPQVLVRVLWLLCEEQATAKGLTPEQWAHRFDGSTVEAATTALVEAVLFFYPRREISRVLRGRLKTVLATADREWAEGLKRALGSTLSGSAGNSPAPSESTPGA